MCGDAWRGLGGQLQVERGETQLVLFFGLGIAGKDQPAAVTGGDPSVEHRQRRELLEHRSRRQTGRVLAQPMAQCDVHAVRKEADEDVRLNAILVLVEHGPDRQVALEILEGFFDLHELDVVAP